MYRFCRTKTHISVLFPSISIFFNDKYTTRAAKAPHGNCFQISEEIDRNSFCMIDVFSQTVSIFNGI